MIKILLVEDNEMNRDALARHLRMRGYKVFTAATGEEAVEQAPGLSPHLILMDLSLPDMDGLEATRRVKAAMQVPIIALTAKAMDSDRADALRAGCDDFDSKPVQLVRLLSKIEALLP